MKTEHTTFNLIEYEAEPFTLDYELHEWKDDRDEPTDDFYLCRNHLFYIKPLPVEVADDIIRHIGHVADGMFSELFDMVTERYDEIGEKAELNGYFEDDDGE